MPASTFNDCSYVNKSAIVGREEAKNEVISWLLAYSNVVECPLVLPIVGMGGIGKTTLAKLVYDDLGDDQFDLKLWACVSDHDTFNKNKLLEDIIKDASDEVISNLTLGQLVQKLRSLLHGKKYFLVLDDIWFEDILANNPLLKSLPDTICNLLNLQGLNLAFCDQLEELPKKINRLLNLRVFYITTCQRSLVGTNFNKLSSLHSLWIVTCNGLVSLWDDDDVGHLTSIRRLCIEVCPLLTRLPNSLKLLDVLEQLVIFYCPALDLEENECLSGFKRLQSLVLQGLPQLTHLPEGIQSAATSLQYLLIKDCSNLNQLMDGLEHFVVLRKIYIIKCPNLLALPEGFRKLNALQDCNYCILKNAITCQKGVQHLLEKTIHSYNRSLNCGLMVIVSLLNTLDEAGRGSRLSYV